MGNGILGEVGFEESDDPEAEFELEVLRKVELAEIGSMGATSFFRRSESCLMIFAAPLRIKGFILATVFEFLEILVWLVSESVGVGSIPCIEVEAIGAQSKSLWLVFRSIL